MTTTNDLPTQPVAEPRRDDELTVSDVAKRIAREVRKNWWTTNHKETHAIVEESIARIVDSELKKEKV